MADDLRDVASEVEFEDESAEQSGAASIAPQPSVVRQHVLDLTTQWKGKLTYVLLFSIYLYVFLMLLSNLYRV